METTQFTNIMIIGAGIAGASAAYEIKKAAPKTEVTLLEREEATGYHSTGRSAALYTEAYAEGVFAKIAKASRPFLEDPPAGFSDHPLLTPRGLLLLAEPGFADHMDRLLETHGQVTGGLRRIDSAQAHAIVPALTESAIVGGLYEEQAKDIDVHALHQGFLKGFKAYGGKLKNNAEVLSIQSTDGGWRVQSKAGLFEGQTVVNAAGAWSDEIARLAGIGPLGLVPKLRTMIAIDPAPHHPAEWPMVVDIAERFYFKPDGARLLASPADATPCEPHDAQPGELEMAIAADHLQRVTDITLRRIAHSWAGLRSFFDDHGPVVGEDPRAPGFCWLAGQGGYGIMTSPTMGRLAAGLVLKDRIPADLLDAGILGHMVRPARLIDR